MARSGNGAEVTETLRSAAAELGRDLSRTAEDAREAAKALAQALGNTVGEASERAEQTSRAVGASMRHHPLAWLSAAAGAGAVLALLISQRPRAH